MVTTNFVYPGTPGTTGHLTTGSVQGSNDWNGNWLVYWGFKGTRMLQVAETGEGLTTSVLFGLMTPELSDSDDKYSLEREVVRVLRVQYAHSLPGIDLQSPDFVYIPSDHLDAYMFFQYFGDIDYRMEEDQTETSWDGFQIVNGILHFGDDIGMPPTGDVPAS